MAASGLSREGTRAGPKWISLIYPYATAATPPSARATPARCGQEIRPFVFELASDGPLSWQLSEPQRAAIYAGWSRVIPVRESFLEYLGAVSEDNRRTELLPLER